MSTEERLNGNDFAALLRAGHGRLRENVHVVNSLNIFPVPDGDTGTNMELSLAAGVAKLNESDHWELGRAAQTLASGLLMGARGNSGVILSQLFRGFSKVLGQSVSMDQTTFATALQEGVQIAYRAVAKPVEGTILTVAREAAAAAVREAKRQRTWADWMEQVLHAAQAALAKTPDQLAVLKQAGVVDSGGQGLVFIYEGFARFLGGEDASDLPASEARSAEVLELDFAGAHITHEGEFGYCTEVLIRVEGHETSGAEESLRKTLSEYGDSLLVVGAEDLVKVHVHTIQPGRVLNDAQNLGALLKIKIDNMTEQHAGLQGQGATAGSQDESLKAVTEVAVRRTKKAIALVVVAAGSGLKEVFLSLGADIVIEGGQTMNPSTQEIVSAVEAAGSEFTLVLPNNKNIVMAAEQAEQILGDRLRVVPTNSIPEGIAAMVAYHPAASVAENVERMKQAVGGVYSGQVVRAVRDSVYQGREISANQFLGFVNQDLCVIGENREQVAEQVVEAMMTEDFELLTVFYGEEVSDQEIARFRSDVSEKHGLEVEARYGGQPIYDYIFALE